MDEANLPLFRLQIHHAGIDAYLDQRVQKLNLGKVCAACLIAGFLNGKIQKKGRELALN